MFLYNEAGLFDNAYFISLCEGGKPIRHQYGCLGCLQFEEIGLLEQVQEPLATIFKELLGCDHADEGVVTTKTGLTCRRVLGEGLCQLEDGRYVATENCD